MPPTDRPGRIRGADYPCNAVWPLTGKPCMRQARTGMETCAAHDSAGDLRPAPPPDEARCVGTNKVSGERCRLHHPPGGKVCRKHGGNAPQIRNAAKTRDRMQKAAAMVATYGLPIEITPEQAILAEVHRTAGHVAWLEQQVHALGEDELVWGLTRSKTGGEDRGDTYEATPNAYLELYRAERAHLAKVCADAIRIGIEGRQVKLAEDQGAMVAKALRAILAELHLTAAQKALIPTVVPQKLRELALTN